MPGAWEKHESAPTITPTTPEPTNRPHQYGQDHTVGVCLQHPTTADPVGKGASRLGMPTDRPGGEAATRVRAAADCRHRVPSWPYEHHQSPRPANRPRGLRPPAPASWVRGPAQLRHRDHRRGPVDRTAWSPPPWSGAARAEPTAPTARKVRTWLADPGSRSPEPPPPSRHLHGAGPAPGAQDLQVLEGGRRGPGAGDVGRRW